MENLIKFLTDKRTLVVGALFIAAFVLSLVILGDWIGMTGGDQPFTGR